MNLIIYELLLLSLTCLLREVFTAMLIDFKNCIKSKAILKSLRDSFILTLILSFILTASFRPITFLILGLIIDLGFDSKLNFNLGVYIYGLSCLATIFYFEYKIYLKNLQNKYSKLRIVKSILIPHFMVIFLLYIYSSFS